MKSFNFHETASGHRSSGLHLTSLFGLFFFIVRRFAVDVVIFRFDEIWLEQKRLELNGKRVRDEKIAGCHGYLVDGGQESRPFTNGLLLQLDEHHVRFGLGDRFGRLYLGVELQIESVQNSNHSCS